MGRKRNQTRNVTTPQPQPNSHWWESVGRGGSIASLAQIFGPIVVFCGTAIWSRMAGMPGPLIFVLGLAAACIVVLAIAAFRNHITWQALVAIVLVGAIAWVLQPQSAGTTSPRARFYQGKQVATRQDLEAPRIVDRAVYLADIPQINGVITEKQFESCVIVGPGVIALGWESDQMPPETMHSELRECHFDANGIDNLFMTVSETAPLVRGTVRLNGTFFRRCDLLDIGLIGSANRLAELKQESPQFFGVDSPPSHAL